MRLGSVENCSCYIYVNLSDIKIIFLIITGSAASHPDWHIWGAKGQHTHPQGLLPDQDLLWQGQLCSIVFYHEFHETCHSVTFYLMKKKTPNNAVTPQPSEEFDLTKMSWGGHDILTATSRNYFTATSFWSRIPNSSWYKLVRSHLWVPCEFPVS